MLNNLPSFKQIAPKNIVGSLQKILQENRNDLKKMLENVTDLSWETLLQPLEALSNRLQRFWSPINHLHAVKQTPELREAYHACLPLLSEYSSELGQNETLYQAVLKLKNSLHYSQLNAAQQKIVCDEIRDFHLAGVGLSTEKKQHYREIKKRLSQLTATFEEQLLDATDHWTLLVDKQSQLQGIPQHVIVAAKKLAEEKKQAGWLLTLQYPCYSQVITYAQDRELRQKMYTAYTTRASDQGPDAGKFDNSPILQGMLNLRLELSQLLDYKNYAEVSLQTKMLKKPDDVLTFLQQLAIPAHRHALEELEELKQFAKQYDSLTELQPWDIAYYSEKLRIERFGISDELLRAYFPLQKVLNGLFYLAKQLFSMEIIELDNVETWHETVQVFATYDTQKQLRGIFYLDAFASPHKQGGAWMDDLQGRWKMSDDTLQIPLALLTCNFTPPQVDQPVLLTHDEVTTLFHEFGHVLHHILTQVDYLSASGINGVMWDAVELPSQLMENFAWEKPILERISAHYQTGEPLPEAIWKNLRASKTFQTGLHTVRQLEFALFDFKLYLRPVPYQATEEIQQLLDLIRQEVAVIYPPAFNRFQHSFSHIFSGGYAAGYYSYLWADVLACDAFARFVEEGLINPQTGRSFLHSVLERGGSAEAMELFVAFRGREPRIEALLQQYNLT